MQVYRWSPVNTGEDTRPEDPRLTVRREIAYLTWHFASVLGCAALACQITADWRPRGLAMGVVGMVLMLYGVLGDPRPEGPPTRRRALGIHYAALAVAGMMVFCCGMWLFALDHPSTR